MGITGYILFGLVGVALLILTILMFKKNTMQPKGKKATSICLLMLVISLACLIGPYVGPIIRCLQ